MRIVVDARMYSESGIGRYIRNLITTLAKLDNKNEYFILHLGSNYEGGVYNTNFHKILANFRWYSIKEQYKLPQILKDLKPDLVHFPHFNVPIFFKGKFVVTIHDLIHQHYSMQRATTHGAFIYKIKNWGYKKVFNHAIKRSQKILVPSNFVKEQLTNEWNVDKDKIIVTPEAVDDKIIKKCQMSNVKCQMLLNKWNIKKPFIFYIGNAHPHKNVEGLIKGFLMLRKIHPNLTLVLSGHDHYFWQRIRREYQNENIIYTGFISDWELVALYKSAGCSVVPSFEEGFGIPLLEAFACFCPVVSSNARALPEVGGDAPLYFDPRSREDMSSKIDRVLRDENLRNELIKKGQKRVKLFSWERLTKLTLEVYNKCV